MYNARCNDYELLYLINEGSEPALNLMYHKYYIYINKIVGQVKIPRYKREDLVQEGVDVFFASIKNYNPDKYNKTFFNYFKINLERKIYKSLNQSTYYNPNFILEENEFVDERSAPSKIITKYRSLLKDEIDVELFENCMLNDMPITVLAVIIGVEYKQLYYKYKCLCERLKKY